MSLTSNRLWLLIVVPVAFLAKDLVATMLVSMEIGVGSKFYIVALLPGSLFVESWVMPFNFIFGGLVGTALWLCFRFGKLWLLVVPALVFFLKDIIALTIAGLSSPPGAIPEHKTSYFIALLPGSAAHKIGDPMLLNVLFGLLLGLILYLYFARRGFAVAS